MSKTPARLRPWVNAPHWAPNTPRSADHAEVPADRQLRRWRQRSANGRVEAGRDHGSHELLRGPEPGSDRERRACRGHDPRPPQAGPDRPLRWGLTTHGDRRPVPGVQGGGGRLPGGGRRVRGAGHRDRGSGVRGARPRRRPTAAAHRGPSGDERIRGRAVTGEASEDLLRDLTPQVLTILVRRYGDFDACEDAVQEA